MPSEQTPQGFASNEKAVPKSDTGSEIVGPQGQTGAVQDATNNAPPGLYGAGGVKSQQNVLSTALPSGAQQIENYLAPYLKELTNLGPEYSKEMAYLAPYLSPAHQSFADIKAGSIADESPTGSKAVQAADTAAEKQIASTTDPNKGLAAAGKQFAGTVPYSEPIQAGLAYQKYLQTYGGEPTNTQGWDNQQAAQAYQGILAGGSTPGGGLPSITAGAAAQTANQNLTNQLQPSTPNQYG